MKILVVLGEGGHTKEMLALVEMLGDDIEYGYLLVDDDVVSEGKIRRAGPVYRARRPRDKQHHLTRDIARTLASAADARRALRAFQPDAVLACGPSVAVPPCFLAKLMGMRVLFVETGSRVTFLSMSGRIAYSLADLFFVQWPELVERYPRAIYAGRLF